MPFTRRPSSGRSSTDQWSRRPPHHTKCTRTAKCFIGRPPGTGSPSLGAPVSSRTIRSNESRFNLSSDDNCIRVWRPRGERLNPAFALRRHIAPKAGVMIPTPHHDILQPHVLPLMQRLPGAIFQQDNARPHTAKMSQDCLSTVATLPWPA
ncbi:transposable element Tcb2 transposase [Trichonephila clavipes]|nr:transposable element Tcb2 transposase [Trichonephila clavipes]